MSKVTLEEAKVIANKVNDLVQESYVNQNTFTIEDVVTAGLTGIQAKRVVKEFMKKKIIYLFEGKYYAHPATLLKLKKEVEKNEQRSAI